MDRYHYLKLLKIAVLAKAGIASFAAQDSSWLTTVLFVLTRRRVSSAALQAFLLGLPGSDDQTSQVYSTFLLDTLAIYCGFQNWAKFCAQNQPTSGDQSTMF